jgi:glycerol-1-phosphate dehydrogenase [NAD(P)+]
VRQVLAGDPGAIADLLGGLIGSGIAMAIVGNSRPASGCEHHASHFWDLLAARGRREYEPHGLQVGYATVFAMRLQQFAFDGGIPELTQPRPVTDPLGPAAREWLGEPTAEIRAAVRDKQHFAASLQPCWPTSRHGWQQACDRLHATLAAFPGVASALAAAGIPDEPGYLDLDAATLQATFRYATRLRARYTVVDLLEGQGRLDAALETSI